MTADDPSRTPAAAPRPTHFDSQGRAVMVDVGAKPITRRVAVASGAISMRPETLRAILDRSIAKGDVLQIARIAGIQGAKRTGDLIPLCHPLPLDSVRVDLVPRGDRTLGIEAEVSVTGRTGVEMEALAAVSIAALTVYDMIKSIDREPTIGPIRLEAKSGGKSGDFRRNETDSE